MELGLGPGHGLETGAWELLELLPPLWAQLAAATFQGHVADCQKLGQNTGGHLILAVWGPNNNVIKIILNSVYVFSTTMDIMANLFLIRPFQVKLVSHH